MVMIFIDMVPCTNLVPLLYQSAVDLWRDMEGFINVNFQNSGNFFIFDYYF